jgi:hypothetical protein
MNGHPFMELPHIAALVRKYQDRWRFCLARKTHAYYRPGRSAQQDLRGSLPRPVRLIHFQENPSKGLNYDTQVHHTRRDDCPDACFFEASGSAKPLYRPHHRRPVVRPQSLLICGMPGSRLAGRFRGPDLPGHVFWKSDRKSAKRCGESPRSAPGYSKRRAGSAPASPASAH